MNTLTLEYFTKNVYGSKKMYFAKRHHRAGFAGLTGKRTFDEMDVMSMKDLFGIEIVLTEVLESAAE